MKITLVGTGDLTLRAKSAIESAELLIGAQRVLDTLDAKAQKRPAVRTDDIINIIRSAGCERLCVVFSGDTGFYSGAASLLPKLSREGLSAELIPGVSSVQLMAAALKSAWQDWQLVSAHGRDCDVVDVVCHGRKTMFLTSGAKGPAALCEELCRAGLDGLSVTVGENLGTGSERIYVGTAEEFSAREFAALNVMLCEAAELLPMRTPGIPDAEFIRAEIPMTKQEVRAAALSKLAVRKTDVCWDVGAGTGSVSVELALCAKRVYAVEEKAEACALIRKNREKFRAWRMELIEGRAPEALEALPAPDAVFIGGSGGELDAIIALALKKNPDARICVSAIAIETLSAAVKIMAERGLTPEVTQISVSRTKSAGSLHLLMAQNPVFLITGSRE